jgi:ATP-dependent Lon protease
LIPKLETEYAFEKDNASQEKIGITNAALVTMVNSYCSHEAGVRNLRKCLDRIFRKIVAKLEGKKAAA